MIVLLFLELEATLTDAPHLPWEQKLIWTDALREDAYPRVGAAGVQSSSGDETQLAIGWLTSC